MINRYPILAFILTVLMIAYLVFGLIVSARMARNDYFTDCYINVVDTTNSHFVSQLEVSQECGNIKQWIRQRQRSEVNIGAIEDTLRACDKIESVNVCILNNNKLRIDVVPMHPVARVFDGDSSYYINVQGKRISADPRYHTDVPVVVGQFSEKYPPQRLLPMLSYIDHTPEVDALVSTVKQEADGDITIIPAIRGHFINFGDTSLVADKFDRVRAFYRNVMALRGWETYDTIAVKWTGQVVATRRNKTLAQSMLTAVVEDYDDIADTGTMTTQILNDSILRK